MLYISSLYWVRQLSSVERLAFNQVVGGSNPSGPVATTNRGFFAVMHLKGNLFICEGVFH